MSGGSRIDAARLARLQAQAASIGAKVSAEAAEREEAAKSEADAALVAKLESAGQPIPDDLRAARMAAEAAEREKALADQAKAIAAAKAQRETERDNASRKAETAPRPAPVRTIRERPAPVDLGPALSPEALADLRRATLARLLAARGVTDPAELEAALSAV